jgi:hypothetical protein
VLSIVSVLNVSPNSWAVVTRLDLLGGQHQLTRG